jgi:hypothetical protein
VEVVCDFVRDNLTGDFHGVEMRISVNGPARNLQLQS